MVTIPFGGVGRGGGDAKRSRELGAAVEKLPVSSLALSLRSLDPDLSSSARQTGEGAHFDSEERVDWPEMDEASEAVDVRDLIDGVFFLKKSICKAERGAKEGISFALRLDLMPPQRTAAQPAPAPYEAARFNGSVYETVRLVPEGRVASYGQVAALLGRPRHARAVGTALKCLPAALASPHLPQAAVEDSEAVLPAPLPNPSWVPWHRIVAANGVISPRGNEAATQRQADWLRAEGVEVEGGVRAMGEEERGLENHAFGLAGAVGGRVSMRRYQWDGLPTP